MSVAAHLTIIDQINSEIAQAEQSLRTAVEHAWVAGVLLNNVKAATAHGAWLPWLEQNINLSPRRAQEWMDLASSYTRAPAHSSIEDALKDVRQQRKPKAADAGQLLQGLAGARDRTELDRRLAEAHDQQTAWSEAQERKRARTESMLGDTIRKMNDACDTNLKQFAIGEILHEAAVSARQASVLLEELAFSFER